MITTSDVKVTPGTGANVATYSITEDAETKQLQRVVLSNSAGTEIDFSTSSTTIQQGNATLATAQVSVGATATQIVAARSGRGTVTVTNTTTTDIYLGNSDVTTTTGTLLVGVKGASITLSFVDALYGIVASGTAAVTAAETY